MSGKASAALDFRIKELDFDFAITGCKNNLTALKELLANTNYSLCDTAFVGDDIIDIPVMQNVGFSIAPVDAHELTIEIADYVTSAKGGQGVAREVAEYILKKTGLTTKEMYKGLIGDDEVVQ